MNSLFQLEIPKRSNHCSHQGEQLTPGMEIVSLLLEAGSDQRFSRRDFCLGCWKKFSLDERGNSAERGHWRSKIEKKKEVEGSTRVQRAFDLLYKLLQSPESREDEIFVLCLFLSHSRRLVLRKEFLKEGNTYNLYEVLQKEEFLTIKSIPLSQVQTQELQVSLAEKLASS